MEEDHHNGLGGEVHRNEEQKDRMTAALKQLREGNEDLKRRLRDSPFCKNGSLSEGDGIPLRSPWVRDPIARCLSHCACYCWKVTFDRRQFWYALR